MKRIMILICTVTFASALLFAVDGLAIEGRHEINGDGPGINLTFKANVINDDFDFKAEFDTTLDDGKIETGLTYNQQVWSCLMRFGVFYENSVFSFVSTPGFQISFRPQIGYMGFNLELPITLGDNLGIYFSVDYLRVRNMERWGTDGNGIQVAFKNNVPMELDALFVTPFRGWSLFYAEVEFAVPTCGNKLRKVGIIITPHFSMEIPRINGFSWYATLPFSLLYDEFISLEFGVRYRF